MKVGIIGAMDVEVTALKSSLAVSRILKKAGMEFQEGMLGNTEVVIVKCGVGKVNAGICVQILADYFAVTHVINTGVAGSLNNDINIGDIVISSDAVYHDVDATVFGYAMGEVPQLGTLSFPADEALQQLAKTAVASAAPGCRSFIGRVLSGDQFIASRQKKEALTEAFGGFCCEMEGCAIAQACYLNQIPYVIIRAISDKADESVEVSYNEFEAAAAEHCAGIVRCMVSIL